MSVYNWLSNVETVSNDPEVVELSFKNGRKKFCYNNKKIKVYTGDAVVIEVSQI